MSTCNKCKFAMLEGKQLYCHRAPPSVQMEQGVGVHFMFAAVMPASWCGEFKLAWKRLFRGHVAS